MAGTTKGRKFPPEILTQGEVQSLMRACSRTAPTGIRDRALIALMWRTGLRISEALALRPSDVDPSRRTVRVANGKGGRHRIVGIDDDALARLDRWLDTRRELPGVTRSSPLFCTLKGGALSAAQVRAMLKRRSRKAGIARRVNPHALRHTLAAEYVEEGQPLTIIQQQLGHASLDGTAHYLRKIAPTDLVKVAQSRPRWDEDSSGED